MDATPNHATPASASRPTQTRESFPLVGTSARPDPRTHAWREDLADVALAGTVIASHYAAPVARVVAHETAARVSPDPDADIVVTLTEGAPFALLDSRGSWAWGYAGEERLVGYVPVDGLVD